MLMLQVYSLADMFPICSALFHYPRSFKALFGRSITVMTNKGLGDNIMAAGVLWQLKLRRPHIFVRFITHYSELFAGQSFVDEIVSVDNASIEEQRSAILIQYGTTLRRLPLLQKMAARLALEIKPSDIKFPCNLDTEYLDAFLAQKRRFTKPVVVATRQVSGWASKRAIPDRLWLEALKELVKSFVVIEVGANPVSNHGFESPDYLNVCSQTTVLQLTALLTGTDIVISPITGVLHLARACNAPALILATGFEDTKFVEWPGSRSLQFKTSCSPCSLVPGECMEELRCLHEMSPKQIAKEARQLLIEKNKTRQYRG